VADDAHILILFSSFLCHISKCLPENRTFIFCCIAILPMNILKLLRKKEKNMCFMTVI